jgi:hypothetical protein
MVTPAKTKLAMPKIARTATITVAVLRSLSVSIMNASSWAAYEAVRKTAQGKSGAVVTHDGRTIA